MRYSCRSSGAALVLLFLAAAAATAGTFTPVVSAPVANCYNGTAWQDTRTLPSPATSPQTLTCTDPDPLNDQGTPSDPPACRDNWGIDRIDQISVSRNNQYAFVNNGTPAHIYMLDTGMLWTHREFLDANGVSRVSGGADARSNPAVAGNATNTGDCYGHGTHVAGIAAGRTYGVAKAIFSGRRPDRATSP